MSARFLSPRLATPAARQLPDRAKCCRSIQGCGVPNADTTSRYSITKLGASAGSLFTQCRVWGTNALGSSILWGVYCLTCCRLTCEETAQETLLCRCSMCSDHRDRRPAEIRVQACDKSIPTMDGEMYELFCQSRMLSSSNSSIACFFSARPNVASKLRGLRVSVAAPW